MRHFGFLTPAQDAALFARLPQEFAPSSPREVLALALGATLYTPGTCRDYAERLPGLVAAGATSAVLCLEDAIPDTEVPAAADNVVAQLRALEASGEDLPLLFVRVREPAQVGAVVDGLSDAAHVLTGFVFPKFTAVSGPAFLAALHAARRRSGRPLYAMPVLETGDVLHAEERVAALVGVRDLLRAAADVVLAVRIGATDLCGLYGLRRDVGLTVYDLAVARDAIATIVNVLRRDGQFQVTGAVWEHYTSGERIFKPQLRTSPFARPDLPTAPHVRHELIDAALDGLLREVVLDKATGIVGKTVIHPSHVRAVHSQYAVTHDEYVDAHTTLGLTDGGAVASPQGDRMVESRPHARWARALLDRADVFGVLRPGRTFVDLLDLEDLG